MSDGITLTGDQIVVARYLSLAHGLALEINTGMSMSRGSVMLTCRELCGTSKRTKRGVLADYVAWLKRDVWPAWEPSASIAKALIKPKG